jgi:hypothetical protein
MTLGTSADLDERLSEAEKFAYDRDMFPLQWNGHRLVLVDNDGYFVDPGRIHYHLTVICRKCHESNSIRGTARFDDPEKIRMVKTVPLGPFFLDRCANAAKRV